jgi:hypothetical protein
VSGQHSPSERAIGFFLPLLEALLRFNICVGNAGFLYRRRSVRVWGIGGEEEGLYSCLGHGEENLEAD